MKIVATNKKAYHDYFVEETYEAGIELVGTEVKSVRLGKVNLRDSYVSLKSGEAFVTGMHISPYEKGSYFNVDPLRARKLLLHKSEILRLKARTEQKGYTVVPSGYISRTAWSSWRSGFARARTFTTNARP